MRKRIRLPQHQRGTTLIEVLVAILVTAIGVMGAAAAQLNAVKFNQTAKFRSTAVFLANDIADRLRANRTAALNGDYDIAMDDDAPSGTSIDVVDLSDAAHGACVMWVRTIFGPRSALDGDTEKRGRKGGREGGKRKRPTSER